jgi:VIT1/CCC1 family predicted Fe2+/Mn2+ transporter
MIRMGVPVADQNMELSSSTSSRRSNGSANLQQSGIRPCMNVITVCVDHVEAEKPINESTTVNGNEKNQTEARDEEAPGAMVQHYSHRAPWLRALVLGANDGLVSIASLMMGVEAYNKTGGCESGAHPAAVSGLAGLVAGACSMAIGEYVSVFSQRDSQLADLQIERQEHMQQPEAELEELTQIYVGRGLTYYLAKQVAEELSRVDALKAHARDELGIDLDDLSNPTQAAVASAIAFAAGGIVPLLSGSFISNFTYRLVSIVLASSVALVAFGAIGARLGGANMCKAAVRVSLGGWLAMLITYGVVRIFAFAHIS